MKKILFSLSLLLGANSYAQDCSDLFISEYLEGLGNNKALEIYNPTDETVDLGNYFVVRYSNGNSDARLKHAVQLRGTLGPKSVHVGVIDKRNLEGEGQEAPIWDDLWEVADEFYCPDYEESNTFYWNGNDAVVLFKGQLPTDVPGAFRIEDIDNVQPLDVFGKIGENPGEPNEGGGWTYDGTPVENGGVVVSADHFLVRKPEVKKGSPNNPSIFNPSIEWDTLSYFTYVFDEHGDTVYNNQGNPARRMNVDNLGMHICDCGDAIASTEEEAMSFGFDIYPNPVSNQTLNLLSTNEVKSVVITDALGKNIKHIPNAKPMMSIDLKVNSGVYFITVYGKGDQRLTKKFIVK